MTREELRLRHLRLREGRTVEANTAGSARLVAHLLTHPWFVGARVVAGYMAIGGEPSITAALDPAVRAVVLPRTVGRQMEMHQWDGRPLLPGVFGILQPDRLCPVIDPQAVELWLVPGLCFDRCGNRLGHGAGHYDRMLAGISAPRLGIAWSTQVVGSIPVEPHDVPMTGIVTERGFLDLRRAHILG